MLEARLLHRYVPADLSDVAVKDLCLVIFLTQGMSCRKAEVPYRLLELLL